MEIPVNCFCGKELIIQNTSIIFCPKDCLNILLNICEDYNRFEVKLDNILMVFYPKPKNDCFSAIRIINIDKLIRTNFVDWNLYNKEELIKQINTVLTFE